MSEISENICIEDIMNEIRAEIRRKGYSTESMKFENMSQEDFFKNLQYLNLHYEIQPYKQLPGNKLAVFFKKIIRKLTKFYIEPVVRDQNEINACCARMLNVVSDHMDTDAEINVFQKQLDALEAEVKESRKYTEMLEQRIEALEKENAGLKKSGEQI